MLLMSSMSWNFPSWSQCKQLEKCLWTTFLIGLQHDDKPHPSTLTHSHTHTHSNPQILGHCAAVQLDFMTVGGL